MTAEERYKLWKEAARSDPAYPYPGCLERFAALVERQTLREVRKAVELINRDPEEVEYASPQNTQGYDAAMDDVIETILAMMEKK